MKHYIAPLKISGQKVPYDAERFFQTYYAWIAGKEFSDRITIAPDYDPILARYHYNSIENALIRYFFPNAAIPFNPAILDIGSGAGHWIDFYLQLLKNAMVVGIDISQTSVDTLAEKYRGNDRIIVFKGDIASGQIPLQMRFDIINAVGVMFHIVEDERWIEAVKWFADHLNPGGTLVVSGQFGWITQNVQFAEGSWGKPAAGEKLPADAVSVNKRIRSLRKWKQCCAQAGLRIDHLYRNQPIPGAVLPENNLIFLKRR